VLIDEPPTPLTSSVCIGFLHAFWFRLYVDNLRSARSIVLFDCSAWLDFGSTEAEEIPCNVSLTSASVGPFNVSPSTLF
jgi:hypothetical protein